MGGTVTVRSIEWVTVCRSIEKVNGQGDSTSESSARWLSNTRFSWKALRILFALYTTMDGLVGQPAL